MPPPDIAGAARCAWDQGPRACLKVIDRTDAIPNHVGRKVASEKDRCTPVIMCSLVEEKRAGPPAIVSRTVGQDLFPFALPDGIIAKHRHSIAASPSSTEPGRPTCRFPMPARSSMIWIWRRARRRQVKDTRHEESRLTFENELFRPIAFALKFSGAADIEQRPIGKTAERFDKAGAEFTLPAGDRFGSIERFETRRAPRQGRFGRLARNYRAAAPALSVYPCTTAGLPSVSSERLARWRRNGRNRGEGTGSDERNRPKLGRGFDHVMARVEPGAVVSSAAGGAIRNCSNSHAGAPRPRLHPQVRARCGLGDRLSTENGRAIFPPPSDSI